MLSLTSASSRNKLTFYLMIRTFIRLRQRNNFLVWHRVCIWIQIKPKLGPTLMTKAPMNRLDISRYLTDKNFQRNKYEI